MKTKACGKCGAAKTIESFCKNSTKKDGLDAWCKKCKAEYLLIYREKNSDSIKRSRKIYYEGIEKEKRNCQQWIEERRKYEAKYRASHKDAFKRYWETYKNKNTEKIKYSKAKYHSSHPEKARIYKNNRRARELGSKEKLSNGLANRLFKLQKGKCACCRKPLGERFHLDHIIPLALGGKNEDGNIQLLRAKCNLQKGIIHPVDFMRSRGYLL